MDRLEGVRLLLLELRLLLPDELLERPLLLLLLLLVEALPLPWAEPLSLPLPLPLPRPLPEPRRLLLLGLRRRWGLRPCCLSVTARPLPLPLVLPVDDLFLLEAPPLVWPLWLFFRAGVSERRTARFTLAAVEFATCLVCCFSSSLTCCRTRSLMCFSCLVGRGS